MARDLESLADVVVLCVKNAMAPLLERLALVEHENAHLKASLTGLTELRDRVVVVETKAAMPPAVAVTSEPIDLSPVLERVAALESSLQRVTVAEDGVADLRGRLTVVETKSATAPTSAPLTASDVELLIRKGLEPVTASIADARERLATLTERAPVPGPAGKDGSNGSNGADGAPGRDGLGFDDMRVEFDGDRTLALTFERGAEKKSFPVVLPFQRYQGVFTEGKSYAAGDGVTWAGSEWHCNEPTTTKPGDGSKAWTLKVKRGRDGKDGKDGVDRLPVVTVR